MTNTCLWSIWTYRWTNRSTDISERVTQTLRKKVQQHGETPVFVLSHNHQRSDNILPQQFNGQREEEEKYNLLTMVCFQLQSTVLLWRQCWKICLWHPKLYFNCLEWNLMIMRQISRLSCFDITSLMEIFFSWKNNYANWLLANLQISTFNLFMMMTVIIFNSY